MRYSIVAALAAICLWSGPVLAEDLTQAEAREEVEILYSAILDRHPDPFWFNGEELWGAEMARLRGRRGPVSHVEQYFDLARLMSLATDTHVQVYPGGATPGFERSYPLRFRLFEEGLFIVAADDPYRGLVGVRVLSVGGAPTDEVIERLAEHSFSDHPGRKRTWGPEYLLPHPATYQYFGWMDDEGAVELEIEDLEGVRGQVSLTETIDQGYLDVLNSGTAGGYYWPEGWATLDDLAPSERPLSRDHLGRNYWYTDLEGGRVIYFQLNSPNDQEGQPTLYDFILAMFADIGSREQTPEQIIVDARHDLGGWIHLSEPIGYLIQATNICCRRGSVVLLTGRETISAGSVFAGSMERATRAVVIGEPTGGRPNIFLGHGIVELPYSGIEPEVSSAFNIGTDSSDTRLFVAPDILVPERVADVIAGRDPALEAALALTDEVAETFYPGETPTRPWTRPSQEGAYRQD